MKYWIDCLFRGYETKENSWFILLLNINRHCAMEERVACFSYINWYINGAVYVLDV